MVQLSAAGIFGSLSVAAAPAAALMAQLPADAPADWRALAAAMACYLEAGDIPAPGTPCRILGLAGGQGAGKSTLSQLLGQALRLRDKRVLVLSLDDFYLTRAERVQLALQQHPLLCTRGVPGSHDLALLRTTLAAVVGGGRHALPVFDKGSDDRSGQVRWFEGPADFIVLEGWCVGAIPQPDSQLVEPCNTLEALEDADGRWRNYVNQRLLIDYQPVWQQLDTLLYLAVPDMAAVRRWRGQQELERVVDQRLTAAQIERFVAHYERLTLWMRETLTSRADIVGFLDAEHRLAALRRAD